MKLRKLKLQGLSLAMWSHGHMFYKVCKIYLNHNWLKLLSLSTESFPGHIFLVLGGAGAASDIFEIHLSGS